jgi:EAL and modified HD-GYP domain-containing signal transduction protein
LHYSYIARQPILDAHKNLFGYELLFRDGPNNKFPDIEAEQATSRLLSEHFFAVHNPDSQQIFTFVNFPYQSLINLIPTLLPKENLVIEILEDCEPNQDLLTAVKTLHSQGYRLALDDFIPSPKWKMFLPYISIIKFDIRIVPIEKAKILVHKLKSTPIQFLAEKVETHREFEQALAAGFTLFQGYFFSKPELIRHKKIDPSIITVIQLCKEIAKSDLDFNAIEALMIKDISLSFKLLTIVNDSANMTTEITSFKQAIVYLGEEKLRKFISLLAIASTASDKPQYLYNLSLQTARFCELIAAQTSGNVNPSSAFLSGMFCYLDSLLDQPLEDILQAIHVEKAVKEALLEHTGLLGLLIRLAKAYEHADWNLVQDISSMLELDREQVASCYDNAIAWTSELFTKID